MFLDAFPSSTTRLGRQWKGIAPPRGWNLLAATCFATWLLTAASGLVAASETIAFTTDVMPVLTRLGCNSGGCHGKSTGQNGFKLSLLGYEPEGDFESLAGEARGRRLFAGAPDQSLLLRKATGAVPHGGGKRTEAGSTAFQILSNWIRQGAAPPRASDPKVVSVQVIPERSILDAGQFEVPLKVTATLSNGQVRDVTQQSVFQSNEPEIADVSEEGVVRRQSRSGQMAVMVRFGEQFAVFQGTVPFQSDNARPTNSEEPSRVPEAAEETSTEVDRLLHRQWTRLGLRPSPAATDSEFIRRATLDICGTLPTTAEVAAYCGDQSADKKSRLIDRLLDRPEYASFFALKWADILQNRGRGYSTSRQRPGTALFSRWIRDSLASNVPYDRFVTEILTAAGSQETNPATVWYRTVRTTENYVESVSQAFLGVRVQCAQCHHHPAERWSQADYYGLAAAFARVGRKGGFADAEVPTSETIFLADAGQVVHPRTGEAIAPRPLGGEPFEITRYDDPRRALARWMTDPENPFFARTMANRLWGHFLGRGIIHPIDDSRSTNPPSNPELLDALARGFVNSRFDVKELIRVICNCSAYGLSASPTENNRSDAQSYARYYPRRLSAEVLLDAISQTLDVPTTFSAGGAAFPVGTRAIDLPDEAVPSHFLDVFGRPGRSSACECERVDSPALGQMLELVGSPEIQEKLAGPDAVPQRLASNGRPVDANVREIFERLFARQPTSDESATAVEFIETARKQNEGYQSLLWSLLATNEFLFNH